MRESYREQVQLLVQILPFVADEACFALKGGTAINLFIRDLPRLSVDIDLTYIPLKSKADSLTEIDASLKRIGHEIRKALPGVSIEMSPHRNEETVTKIQVQRGRTQVKVEVTPVLHGCVFEPEWRTVTPSVEEQFGFAEIQVVSLADLYAGKIVAALDRQHPRDLFDVRNLLANEGIIPGLREAFLVYLLSGRRPLAELLAPSRRDIRQEYERGFQGMATTDVSIEELEAAREDLLGAMVGGMPDEHRAFLFSVKEGEPRWDLLTVTGIKALPAVQWRLQNLAKMNAARRMALLEALRKALRRT